VAFWQRLNLWLPGHDSGTDFTATEYPPAIPDSALGMRVAEPKAMPSKSSMVARLVLTALISGCVAPEPVLRLTPLAENVLWIAGQAATIKEGKAARVAVAFAHQQEALLGFRVEIENTASVPVLVNPSSSYYATCTRSPDGKRQCHPARWAVDPETVLLNLDIAHSRQKADTMNEAALLTPLLFLSLGTAMVGTASRDHHATSNALGAGVLASTALDASQLKGQQQAMAYAMGRANWESAALRKSTLPPGGRVAGLLYVARDVAANEVSLQIRVGDEILTFAFNQLVIDARRRRTAAQAVPRLDWRGQ
jgi:hypothetical protein